MSLQGLERMSNEGLLPSMEENAATGWKNTFTGRFICKYPRYYSMIHKLEFLFGRLPEWSDFTKQSIEHIVNSFPKCAQSSKRTYLAMIKSILNDAKDEFNLPYIKFSEKMNVKATPSVNIYLNLKDLEKLEAYKPENEKEKVVLAQFLCGCYTGARHSDILNMTADNIQGKYLTYVSQKTKIQATIEAKPVLKELLPVANSCTFADSTFNLTIRDICRKVGINDKVRVFRHGKIQEGKKYEFVASHTARRSFATNLADLGVPVLQIAKRMGHTDIRMTMRYICSSIGKLDDAAMEFFS